MAISNFALPKHQLGKNGPHVAAIGFGTMNMSIPHYGQIEDDEERFRILDRALEIGATFWDTADIYADSELLIGKWFERTGKRNEIFLATKFGLVPGDNAYGMGYNSSAEHCKIACNASLKKLGIDCIDLYYLHHANPDTPIEETMRALVELKNEGKIKYIGLSNINSNTLQRAHKVHPIIAVQLEYSAFTLEIENEKGTNLLQTCRELGVAIVCYSPLGRGLLTSTFQKGDFGTEEGDLRTKAFPKLREANRKTNQNIVDGFGRIAEKHGCTITQLALAWLLKQGVDIFPNPGTKKIKYLEENIKAAEVNLTDEDEKEIRQFVEKNQMVGGRLPEQFAEIAYVDTREES